jgi:S-(hydroxymethyl)glutathione dehydrogenase / alcohol dehydrogenase
MLVHENAIVKIRRDMLLDLAALIGCGVVTGYGAVVNTAKVAPGETVVVIGCGGVGMAAINGAEIAAAGRIIAVDTNPAKLQLATKARRHRHRRSGERRRGAAGARVDRWRRAPRLRGAGPQGDRRAGICDTGARRHRDHRRHDSVRPEDRVARLRFLRERKIQGSSMGSNHLRVDVPRLVEFYMRGRLHLDDWISAQLKLPEINAGFAAMKAGKTVRSVIVFDA